MGNLDLWNAVERTPVEHTKKITGKSYQGNSPKPHFLVHKATETFGPVGIGWGFTVEERVEDGAQIEPGFYEKMHVAKVRVWFKWNGERGEVEHIGGTMFSGRYASGKVFTDEDAPKKSVTDALVKALSMIGFAGDIFMGRYDDNKYIEGLKAEASEATKPKADPDKIVIADTMVEAMKQSRDRVELEEWHVRQKVEIEDLDEVNRERVLNSMRGLWKSLPKAAA